jgi:hypothetical protein
MTEVVLKCILILLFVLILIQDYKDRLVYWFLFPVTAVISFLLFYFRTGLYIALTNTIINLFLGSLIIITSAFITSKVLKKAYLNKSIGLGDILMIVSLSFTFASVTHIILLTFSFIFSFILHFYMNNTEAKHTKHTTVPLAGYMAAFYAIVYIVSLFAAPKYFYSY